jgi:AraC family transcriptional regulator
MRHRGPAIRALGSAMSNAAAHSRVTDPDAELEHPVHGRPVSQVLRLSHGQFLGETRRRMEAGSFLMTETAHTRRTFVPLHSHEDAHFVFIVSGAYDTIARQQGHHAEPRLIFNPAGTTHRDHFRSETGRFFTITVARDEHTRLEGVSGRFTSPTGFGSGDVALVAARIVHEFRQADAHADIVLEGLAIELLGHVAREFEVARRGHPPAWLKRAIEMIRERCHERISIRQVAAEVGVHPYHLARTARTFFGKNPAELLGAFRIERAVALLADDTRTLVEVALDCGYADQSQFTRSFRRAMGTTPAAFRRLAS